MDAPREKRKISEVSPFLLRKNNIKDIKLSDLENPHNLYYLLSSPDSELIIWLQENHLLAQNFDCLRCGEKMTLSSRPKNNPPYAWRCRKAHEISASHFSIFANSHHPIQDTIVFFTTLLNKNSLRLASTFSGFHYNSTAVRFGSLFRNLFKEWVLSNILEPPMIFTNRVEIDESLFGRKTKYHRGAKRGTNVWIFGIVECDTNRLILYPVENRKRETLIPIIKRHVAPNTQIFSDGFSAYGNLNQEGFQHFVVNHKQNFVQFYENPETKQSVKCCTNKMEGAWANAQEHFKSVFYNPMLYCSN